MNLSLVKKYINPNSILDIGANIGQFYNHCKQEFPNSYYFLIEGNEHCEENLKGLNVDYSMSLLSSEKKEVDFYVRKNEIKCTGNSIYREKTPFFDDSEITIVKKTTKLLDDILSEMTFDLIKIDVQGSELDIMKGGLNIIKKCKAIILEIPIVEYNLNSPNKSEIYQFMESIGFEAVEVLSDIPHPINHNLIQQDVLFIKNNNKKKDKLAIVTVMFDYPGNFKPPFYDNAIKYFNEDDIYVARLTGFIDTGSYYDKLFYYKVVGLLKFIEENIVNKYDYILFLDGTDTNFISPPTEIIEKFRKFDCSVLLGAEYGLWPPTHFNHLYDSKPKLTDKFYLNSGTYIGYTDKIIFHLKDIIDKKYQEGIDDQGRWAIQYLLNDDLKIDQECKIFFSTYLAKKDVIMDNNELKLNNLEACIIHDNGPYGDETIKLTDIINSRK
jgi:FkbM family methyltransferase